MTTHADGRDTRWAAHRAQRRRQLVEATLRAIRTHGPSVGMDDIAAAAGTSKTVIYRHFGGRTGLYAAVVESVDQRILDSLGAATAGTDPHDVIALVREMVDAFLQLVEKDAAIYRFVLTRPLVDGPVEQDPVTGLADRIGAQVTQALEQHLARQGRATDRAATWGHGLVGFVRAAADHWLTTEQQRPRSAVVDDVTALFTPALGNTTATSRTNSHPDTHPVTTHPATTHPATNED